jgi:hypothetical protein
MNTVTVTRKGKKGASASNRRRYFSGTYILAFSKLPGRTYGPWLFDEAVTDLTVSALLSAVEARNLVLDAFAAGSATAEMGTES